MQYYEDLKIGRTQKFGSKLVILEEVLDFAKKFDPQDFTCQMRRRQRRISGGFQLPAGIVAQW
jgi:hypothetical protein